MRSSGLAEVWTHTHDNLKFKQFGWRCTTKENSYSDQTLVGNWNQQRFDTQRRLRRVTMPGDDDTWDTTYREGYNRIDLIQENEASLKLKANHKEEKNAFPHHQPEEDPLSFKHHYKSFSTTQRASYGQVEQKELMKKYKEKELTGPLLNRGHEFLSQVDNATPFSL